MSQSKPSSPKHYMTQVRQLVLSVFSSSPNPLSAREVNKIIESDGSSSDRSTIYRQIERLLEEKILTEVNYLDGKKRFEFAGNKHHHHHLVCEVCHKVICVDIDESVAERIVQKQATANQFTISRHIIEFFGTCNECKTHLSKQV